MANNLVHLKEPEMELLTEFLMGTARVTMTAEQLAQLMVPWMEILMGDRMDYLMEHD